MPFGPKVATRCDTALVALDLRLDLDASRVFLGFGLGTELFVCHGVTRVASFWASVRIRAIGDTRPRWRRETLTTLPCVRIWGAGRTDGRTEDGGRRTRRPSRVKSWHKGHSLAAKNRHFSLNTTTRCTKDKPFCS
jgi:hypothetical protein